jgi:hypothetical protein
MSIGVTGLKLRRGNLRKNTNKGLTYREQCVILELGIEQGENQLLAKLLATRAINKGRVMNTNNYHLVSTIKGKVKVIRAEHDTDKTKVFHGRYSNVYKAIERAMELNEKRGK